MKLIVKKYSNGITLRVEGGDKAKHAEIMECVRQCTKGKKDIDIVSSFEEPLPECAPGEPKCS